MVCVRFLRTQQRVKNRCQVSRPEAGAVPLSGGVCVCFGRIILWLELNDQLFLSWLFDFSRVFEPFFGFKVCSLRELLFGVAGGGCLNINGEFDPGSGRTLAACLTHASRTVMMGACSCLISGERVSNT